MKEAADTFGWRLKRIRNDTGLTQERFAETVGSSRDPIAKAEANKSILHKSTIQTICEIYGINQTWLLTGNGHMKYICDIPEKELNKLLNTFSRLPQKTREQFIALMEDYVTLTKSSNSL